MEHDPRFPVARPMEIAVEAGVFGWEVEGPCRPGDVEVRSLTEEHARDMLGVLADLAWLERCAAAGLDPQSGKLPRGSRGRERIERIPKEVNRLRESYGDLLAVYEEGFGRPAADALNAFVRSLVPAPPDEEQRRLF